jgi:hypothetical protein
MKKNLLFALTLFCSLSAFAQFNPPMQPNTLVSNTLGGYISNNTYNVGMDYQGNSFGADYRYAIVTDYPEGTIGGNPALYIGITQQYTGNPIAVGKDPDVVIMGTDACVISYKINTTTNDYEIWIDVVNNINTSPTLSSSTMVASFPYTTSFIPVVNIDANSMGDWVICYSESKTIAHYALGNGSASLVTPSFTPMAGATYGEYVKPDVAIDDNAMAYSTSLDNNNKDLCVYDLNSNTLIYSKGGGVLLDEPRIACPPAGGNNSLLSWAVANITENYSGIALHYQSGTSFYNHSLTNGSSGLYALGTQLQAKPSGSWNYRPCISFNTDACSSLSVNWFNTATNQIIGVEIESGAGQSAPLSNLRYAPSSTPIKFNELGPKGRYASAVCSRYADLKAAAYVIGQSVVEHTIDCIGSWRIGKPHNNSANIQSKASSNTGFIITPNPATNKLTLKMANDLELNNAEIKIENVVGQEFSTLQLDKNTTEQNINIAELPNGIYFIKVIIGKNLLFTNKFVKQ